MRTRIIIYLSISLLLACQEAKQPEPEEVEQVEMGVLIDTDKMQELMKRSNVRLIDFRKPEQYALGHIAGAVNIWRSDIENPDYPYKGIMPSAEHLSRLLGARGIGSDDVLVIYDEDGLCNAARLWWVLHSYGFDAVHMLDGGLHTWTADGGSLSTEIPSPIPVTFQLPAQDQRQMYLSKEDMLSKLGTYTLLDTRTTDEFSGKRQKSGAAKAGRIPGSHHIDWASAVHYDGDKKFRSMEELEAIYGKLLPKKEDTILVYCHSGVRSAHTSFVLTELLGYQHVMNYDGSWVEWSHFDELPIEMDSITIE